MVLRGSGVFEPLGRARLLEEWRAPRDQAWPPGESTGPRQRSHLLRAQWPEARGPKPRCGSTAVSADENSVHVVAAAITGHADKLS